jgi:ABC-type Fe3+/spermidine/putrescine transport system ATPase subunit
MDEVMPGVLVKRARLLFRREDGSGWIDLPIAPDEVHTLLRPSGAGKTTLIRVLGNSASTE